MSRTLKNRNGFYVKPYEVVKNGETIKELVEYDDAKKYASTHNASVWFGFIKVID